MEFCDIFKELRKSKGYTQADIAKIFNASPSLISAYELGRRKPSYEMLEEIASYFGVTVNYLMARDDQPAHFIDAEAARIAQEMHDRPELKTLFETSRKVSADDLKIVQDMINRLAGINDDQ